MGDRICIRLCDGESYTPTFYGHWCGLRGLKAMIEALREPYNTMGCCMCNFIVKVKEGKTSEYSYDLWNDNDTGTLTAADGDWYTWTYYLHKGLWTTTHPLYRDRLMTNEEVEDIVKANRPCLYRTCPCEHYGEKWCATANYERFVLPMERRLHAKGTDGPDGGASVAGGRDARWPTRTAPDPAEGRPRGRAGPAGA